MANDDFQERTEEATPKRLRDAQEKGQVARSRELNTLGVLVASGVAIGLFGPSVSVSLTDVMRESFAAFEGLRGGHLELIDVLVDGVISGLTALLPIFAVLLLAAAIVPMTTSGWVWSSTPLNFQWERMDLVKGLQRIFSLKGLVELIKAFAKVAFMASVGGAWLYYSMGDVMSLGRELGVGIYEAGEFLLQAFLIVTTPMIVIAAIDVPFQVWDHAKQLKMSRKEIKDEMKETDGNPELKAKIRQQQQEVASRRMMEAVPGADVIIVNPTHYAVALKYDADTMSAPVLVAKGVDFMAAHIRDIGAAHGVTQVRSPLLARAIFYNAELDYEIPTALFSAVAQVLAYVFRLQAGQAAYQDSQNIELIDVPSDLRTE